jgi:polar amino acid transport system substrate-binding protein
MAFPVSTLKSGILAVASAYPDPPFDIWDNGKASGFDIELMSLLCERLGLTVQWFRYLGDDFNGIFDGLTRGQYDAVISGTTITPERAEIVLFSNPYLEFDQGIAINSERTPKATSVNDLRGMTVGIQKGNTSDIVAKRLLAQGQIASIRYYPYHGMPEALSDLENGHIGAIIKLFPVISWFVRDRSHLKVVTTVHTHEQLGIAYARTNTALRDVMNETLQKLRSDGTLAQFSSRWFSDSPPLI